eukprot:3984187-Pyramimonas_sp.AAC.1
MGVVEGPSGQGVRAELHRQLVRVQPGQGGSAAEAHPKNQQRFKGRAQLRELQKRPEAQGAHFVSSRGPVAH